MKKTLQFAFVFLLLACGNENKKNTTETKQENKQETSAEPVDALAKNIGFVHQKREFAKKGMVQFQVHLQMNDAEPVSQTVRIATENLTFHVGGKNENLENSKSIEYAKLFALPFLLDVPGSQITPSEISMEKYNALKLTFTKNPTLLSASAYTLFADDRTNLLTAVAFSEGEKQLIVRFENYITVKNIPVATTWEIFERNEKGELFGKLLGTVKISQISFSVFSPETKILDEPSKPPIS